MSEDLETLIPTHCPACGHENLPYGALGRILHYRCRACGVGYGIKQEEPPASSEARG